MSTFTEDMALIGYMAVADLVVDMEIADDQVASWPKICALLEAIRLLQQEADEQRMRADRLDVDRESATDEDPAADRIADVAEAIGAEKLAEIAEALPPPPKSGTKLKAGAKKKRTA